MKIVSPVVKVTESWPEHHKFEPSTAEDLSRRGTMHGEIVEAQTSSLRCGVVVRREYMYTMYKPSYRQARDRRCVSGSSSDVTENRYVERLMLLRPVVEQSSYVGVVWKLGEWGTSSDIVLVT
ncbi:hypothetical protein TNCV_188211 [Trichonephila clavipes]|nr:hypothetical protein TNCV_188211 [Trichonephila clavipes]